MWVARLLFRVFFSAVIATFLFPCSPYFFKYSRDTVANKTLHVSTSYSLLYSALMLHPRFFTALSFSPSDRRCSLNTDVRLFSYRVLIALGLFCRKLPIRNVNGDVCVYSDPIFSSSGQWPRNALMQIVAITPRCGELPRRDRYTRFNPLALSLCISLFLYAR